MLQIKLINVYGSHSQLTLLASLINNSCYSQTAVQFIISKKKICDYRIADYYDS